MKKLLVSSIIFLLLLPVPAYADNPDLEFEYKEALVKDTFIVKIYKKKMSKKSFTGKKCNSYLSFKIKRKIAKGKKDPQNETKQSFVLYFSYLDESKPDKKGAMFSQFNFLWPHYRNNTNFETIRGCYDITKKDLEKPIIVSVNAEFIDPDPSYILN